MPPPAPGLSISTFGDHSVSSGDYPEVASCLPFPPRTFRQRITNASGVRLAGGTEPGHQSTIADAYDETPEIFIRGRLGVVDPDVQLGFMVDESRRVVAPSNAPAHGERASRFSLRLASTPWTETAKATYRVRIHFYLKLPQGKHKSEPEYSEMLGTAIHVGEGLFLTNIHVVKWPPAPMRITHTSHVGRIWLFSGTGNLDKRHVEEPSLLTKGSLEVTVTRWPGPALADALLQGHQVRGGLMDSRYRVRPEQDFCLLEAKEKRWKSTLRQESRPHVLPARIDSFPRVFEATLVAINGDTEDFSKYDPNVNSIEQLGRTLNSLRPGVITYATTNNAIQYLPGRRPAPNGTLAQVIRYAISSAPSSSGSGLYVTSTKRLVGIHSRAEVDPVCVLPGAVSSLTSTEDRGVAISISAPEFGDFVRTILIPELMRIGTPEAKNIAAEWALAV
jgi:hypothetical protein